VTVQPQCYPGDGPSADSFVSSRNRGLTFAVKPYSQVNARVRARASIIPGPNGGKMRELLEYFAARHNLPIKIVVSVLNVSLCGSGSL